MSSLVYPTLDLFLYDLKEVLNTTQEVTRKNQEYFAQRLPNPSEIVDSDIESEYLELLPQKKTQDFQTSKAEGYYYPVRLNDTYGLQIDCSVNNQTEPQAVEWFCSLKSEIELQLKNRPITLGQAWILSGWLPENSNQNPKEIAQDCYRAFAKNGNWQRDFQGEGTFLGGKIFQLWQPVTDFVAESSNHLHLEHTPILIAIYPNQASAQKAANFYPDWMGLFCYYSKINWAYAQSRLIKKDIFSYYKKVEDAREKISFQNHHSARYHSIDFEQALDNIQQATKQYNSNLLELAFQKQVIDINLINYQTRLEFIRKNPKVDANSQLEFLNQFSDLVTKKYLVQIDKDSENMQLGFRLLENNINAVRSRIELAKAERDRSFQEFVAVVSAGIAAVSFAPADKNCEPIFSKTSSICKVPVLFSLLIFVIAAGLAWLIRKQWRRSS